MFIRDAYVFIMDTGVRGVPMRMYFFVMNKDCVFVSYRAGVLFALGKGDGLLVK